MVKIVRACTVAASIGFVKDMIPDLAKNYDVVLLSSPGNGWWEINHVRHLVKCKGGIKMPRQIDFLPF